MRCPCGSGLSVGNCHEIVSAPNFDHPHPVCRVTGCTEAEEGKPECAKGTCVNHIPPQLSIKVGAQVRLTGVVESVKDGIACVVFPDYNKAFLDLSKRIGPDYIEVIRQPFKRGEVVYRPNENIPCVVLVSESNGKVVLTEAREGACAREMNANEYERRP